MHVYLELFKAVATTASLEQLLPGFARMPRFKMELQDAQAAMDKAAQGVQARGVVTRSLSASESDAHSLAVSTFVAAQDVFTKLDPTASLLFYFIKNRTMQTISRS